MELKQPKTYNEQVDLIRNKGFIVDDAEQCISFLKKANYYRVSAYFLPFRKIDGSYFSNIEFIRIERIYEFDCELRTLLFQVIEQVELYMRTTLSYYIAHKYGPLGYLNKDIYSKKHDVTVFNEKIDKCIQENKRTLVVKHHEEKYDGKFPAWVIIDFFSMGMLSYCYGDLNSADQKTIAHDAFDSSSTCIASWFRCLTDLRNRCAHYSRLYYWIFPAIPLTPKGSDYQMDRKLFSQIVMLKYLVPDKEQWNKKYVPRLENLLKEYESSISLKHIGFPDNWKDYLIAEK